MRPGRFLIGLSALATAGFIFAAAEACANMPVKDWEVGPINAPSSSGVGYCSVKNFYQQGQGLVVARDAEGSASLALSFQQKFMTSGGQYTIGLRAGNVARQMIALAATPQVLVVQLGLDREFYNALQKKNELQVSLRDKEISFALNGAGEALAALTKCTVDISRGKAFSPVSISVKQPPAGGKPVEAAEMPDMPATSLAGDAVISSLKDEIERLKVENRKLLAENQRVTAQLLDAERGGDSDLMAEMETQRAALRKEAESIARKAADLQARAQAAGAMTGAETGAKISVTPAPRVVAKRDTFLEDLLRRAQLPAEQRGGRYAWEVKDLFGSAEERTGPLAQTIDTFVAQAKSRCTGDFAHNESKPVESVTGIEFIEGEFACIDGRDDAAAALLFVNRNGKTAIITHEGTTDQMEDALSTRSAVVSTLAQ